MSKKPRFNIKLRLPEIVLFFLLLISSVSLGFKSGSFILNIKQIGFSIFSSVEKSVNYVYSSITNTFNAVSELRQLRKDYNDLVLKLENYEEMQRSNAEIRKENERLKEQLDFSISLDEKNIPSRIISRDLDSAYSYLTIDKGSVNGIKKGMPVIAFQNGNNGLVGKIVQVGTFTAQVMPVYNIDNIVSARIQKTRDLGLVNGLGSLDQPLNLKYIRKSIANDLSYGDIVVTSGENDNYMKDIPIGSISKIAVLDYESSLTIELNPILDFSRLENVIVVNQKELNDRKDN
ncbi:MAG: rod shape-determining protein MreC [Treponema sp.]|nr:rod shape-determining protein MreC [Treponema sp.]MCI5665244.1 rod shape-determining protein MreC [Spirochaetia bacterium]MDD7768594.1 rod shape-determining protein MreC [Treponema sp.]MDY3130995.1 rod shape-determining protein MreC [Treponema sp.]